MNTKNYLESGEPLTKEQKDFAEQLYLEQLPRIEETVWRLIMKYGGDFEDMMGEANAIFLAALATYDNSIGFEYWLRNWVRWELIDKLRVRLTHQSRYEYSDVETVAGRQTSKFQDLLEGLSEDARIVIDLVIDTPKELEAVIEGKGGQPRNYRSSIRDYLDSIGWTYKRVADTFAEIKATLA